MTNASAPRAAWAAAFPIGPANDALEAVCDSWAILASRPRADFHKKKREDHLTRVIKTHVERVTASMRGLIGMWAAENVINRVDFETGTILEERRNDIVYGWNDQTQGYQLVLEFKKLTSTANSRNNYLGDNGVGRFVSGMYSHGQPIAVMVGLLIGQPEEIVPKLCKQIGSSPHLEALRLQKNGAGEVIDQPSKLFAKADFDTDHDRPPPVGPPSGTIRVAHLFLEFRE